MIRLRLQTGLTALALSLFSLSLFAEQSGAPTATACANVLDSPLSTSPAPTPLSTGERVVAGSDKTENGATYQCSTRQRDLVENFEELLLLGPQQADLVPGLLLDGDSVRRGTIQTLALPRSPITLSIDAPVANPTRRVAIANSAGIKAEVASLRREADISLGSLPELPAQIASHVESVHSFEEAAIAAGVSVAYSAPLASAKLNTSFASRSSAAERTVLVKLYQPLFTISFADDEFTSNNALFSKPDDWQKLCAFTSASASNPPAYIKAVTYGRIALYTLTSSDFKSDKEFELSLTAAFGAISTGEVNATIKERLKSVVNRSTIRVLALGGPEEAALKAIREADFREFFVSTRAITAVPIAYRFNYLVRGRPVMKLEAVHQQTVEECKLSSCTPPPLDRSRFETVIDKGGGLFGGSEDPHFFGPCRVTVRRWTA